MKTPKAKKITAEKSSENDKSKSDSAKKLVQARLPFKVISTTISDDIPNSSSLELKKRKLSDKDYDANNSITETDDDKEEVNNKKVKLIPEECVTVVLSDEDHIDEDPKVHTAIIKLPFSSKKNKRRKNYAKNREVSSDDADKPEILHPQKRAKLAEAICLDTVEAKDKQQEEAEKIKENEQAKETETKNVDEKESSDEQKKQDEDEEMKEKKNYDKIVVELSEDSECNSCSSTSEDKETTANMLTSDAQKTVDQNVTTGENKVKKPLTKKQLDLMERRRQAREEKGRKLQEEKMQKQKEKEEREEAKKREREEKEEQKRKEREEKEEKKRQEREEKERKRLAEIEAKNEEKRKRTEAREEERKRKDLEKEEAELKAKKRAEAFTKFFVPKTEANEQQENELAEQPTSTQESTQNLAFRPFQVKGAMKLAPICRRQLTKEARESFDQILQQEASASEQLYLQQIKTGKHLPIKCPKAVAHDVKETSSEIGDDDDTICIIDELAEGGQPILLESHVPVERMRAKFYKFTENRRPPYYGTWRKRSKVVNPRKPFAQDKQIFDYEVDSDLEWEEEEPGESLEDSEADEKDKESEENDDYDVDNEWMVPHGHLSEEEMENEEEGVVLGDENTREAQKAKLQILQQEFAMEMKKKTKKIQPRLVGCIWVDLNGKQPDTCSNIIWQSLNMRAMLCNKPPLLEPQAEPEPVANSNDFKKLLKPILLNESMSQELIRLIHGNSHSKDFLVKEFIAHLEANEPSVQSGAYLRPFKSTVRRKIEKYAVWKVIDDNNNNNKSDNTDNKQKKKNKKRLCWVVNSDILSKKGLENLSLNNEWKYILSPKVKKRNAEEANKSKNETLEETSNETAASDIQLIETVVEKTESPIRTTAPIKKRVPILMSVARGKQIPSSTKNALISNFLKNPPVNDSNETEEQSETPITEIITLD